MKANAVPGSQFLDFPGTAHVTSVQTHHMGGNIVADIIRLDNAMQIVITTEGIHVYARPADMDEGQPPLAFAPMVEVQEEEQEPDTEPCCMNPGGHEWVYTGTAYGGDDSRWRGEGRCYCAHCGADGDA